VGATPVRCGSNLSKDPIGKAENGKDVFLKDIWPVNRKSPMPWRRCLADMFERQYAGRAYAGCMAGDMVDAKGNLRVGRTRRASNSRCSSGGAPTSINRSIRGARIRGSSATPPPITFPARRQNLFDSPADTPLKKQWRRRCQSTVRSAPRQSRRMMRGNVANIRINEMVPGTEGA
jgi:aconitate hydratase